MVLCRGRMEFFALFLRKEGYAGGFFAVQVLHYA